MNIEKRKWVSPFLVAESLSKKEKFFAFLYSGMRLEHTGQESIICFRPDKTIKDKKFSEINKSLSNDREKYKNFWVGYLSYQMKNELEKLPLDKKSFITFPKSWLIKFKVIIVFHHLSKTITIYNSSKENLDFLFKERKVFEKTAAVKIGKVSSNMKKAEYLKKVKEIKDQILRGDLYQANLTRKFFGSFKKKPNALAIFKNLCETSPSPYSAFLRFEDKYIISSSPESFIKVNSYGHTETRPIKGTAPNSSKNKTLANFIKSEKDKAENLMIVDLMRNDLARSCVPGTVKVESLYDITSYSAVHHMSSTISGQKRADISSLELVKNSFPPGSMTGAPKLKAIEVCSTQEKLARGVYSGALGWFGGNGSLDLSVVIRTILIDKNKFEFQVGGGIVADSKPKDELKETFYKASAICKVLGISGEKLKKI